MTQIWQITNRGELNLDIRLISKYCLKLSLKLFCSNYMNDASCQIILVSGWLIDTYFALASNNLLSFSSANSFWIKFYRKVVEAEVYGKSWWILYTFCLLIASSDLSVLSVRLASILRFKLSLLYVGLLRPPDNVTFCLIYKIVFWKVYGPSLCTYFNIASE